MVTSSKILTVTYGTFSCTLEGFDDPFTTLQMVAEYFRKLAAEDRFFGGVPQMPDTDTLKRIAEEHNPKGVAAEIGDNGIILRQAEEGTDTGADLQDDLAASDLEQFEETAALDDDAQDLDAQDEDHDDEALADETLVISTPSELPDPGKAVASPVTFFRSRRAFDDDDVDAPEITDSDETDEVATFSRHTPAAPKSVEETLAAIRQNVQQAETEIDAAAAASNSEPTAEDDAADQDEHFDDDLSETLILTNPASDPSDTLESTIEDTKAVDGFDAAVARALVTETPVSEQTADETSENAGEFEAESEGDDLELIASTDVEEETTEVVADSDDVVESDAFERTELDDADVEDDTNADTPEIETTGGEIAAFGDDNADELPDVVAAKDDAAAADPEITPESEAAEKPVDSAFDAEFEKAFGAKTADENEADDEDAVAEVEAEPETPFVSSLSDEEEAELARDLEEALEATDADEEVDTEAEERRLERRARAEALRNSGDVEIEERALDRLLQTTQSKMNKPEQTRRVNALDQLKAAVAATEAEHHVLKTNRNDQNAETAETANLAAYREDLRRAQSKARLGGLTSKAAPRPAQAPLILVSEQRIDEQPVHVSEDPVPEPMHEVAQTDGNLALKPAPEAETEHFADDASGEIQGIPADAFSDANNFADFAERIGAFELQDLLEAAAAYTSIVEGKARFSRAQVMSKIAKLDTNSAFSKEAGLRSFGRLLREGKILRVQDGQFAISKASRFSIASRYDD